MHEFNFNSYRSYWIGKLTFWERSFMRLTRAQRINEPGYCRSARYHSRRQARKFSDSREPYPEAWLPTW